MITKYEKKIISTQVFNRLHNISQNSTAYLTYPSNRTKRFEHSIGTMHLCGIMFKNGITNAEIDTIKSFVSAFKQEMESDKNFIFDGDTFKSYQEYMSLDLPKFDLDIDCKNGLTTVNIYLIFIMYQAVRIAALLHDLGHPPFSHVTENAFKTVFEKLNKSDEKNDLENRYIHLINQLKQSCDIHESIGNKISQKLLDEIEINEDLKKAINPVVNRILASNLKNKKQHPITYSLHSIIANSIDADRLDYIFRDSANSGVDIGQIDYNRMFSSISLVNEQLDFHFLIDMRFRSEIEEYFRKRLEMYKKIVYHHRVVKTDKLLHEILVYTLENSLKQDETDPFNKIWMIFEDEKNILNDIPDWDDAFLLHTLKQIYKKGQNEFSPSIKAKFCEFLTNNKEYISLIKSQTEYRNFVRKINEDGNADCLIKLLSNNFEKDDCDCIVGDFRKSYQLKEDYINQFNNDIGYIGRIKEVLIILNSVSNGLSKGFKVYQKEGNKIRVIDFDNEISKIKMQLDNEVRDIQKIFLYIRTDDNQELNKNEKSKLMDTIIKYLNEELKYVDKGKNGLFIAVDGPNGSGKTTIIKQAKELLEKEFTNCNFCITKEPTKSQLGAFTREISNSIKGEELARLVNIDRMIHEKEIEHLKKQYDIVFSDRYIFSSYILQGVDRVDFDTIYNINSNIKLKPDLQVVINGEADIIMKRLEGKLIYNRLENNKTTEEIEKTKNAINELRKKKDLDEATFFEIIASNRIQENDYYENSYTLFNKVKEMLNDK
jgi:dTMP kinase